MLFIIPPSPHIHKIMDGHLDVHYSVRTSVRTSRNFVCATPPTLLDGFCSFSSYQLDMKMTIKKGLCDAASFTWVMDFVISITILNSKRNYTLYILFFTCFQNNSVLFFGTKMFGRHWLNFCKDCFVIELLKNTCIYKLGRMLDVIENHKITNLNVLNYS